MRRIFAVMILLLVINLYAISPSAFHEASNELSLLYDHPSNSTLHSSIISKGLETSVTRIFNLKQLSYYNFHTNYSVKSFAFAYGIAYLDNPLYQEYNNIFSTSYSWKQITFGYGLNYIYTKTNKYSDQSAMPMNLSCAWKEDNFCTVFSLHNIFSTKLANVSLPKTFIWESNLKINKKSNFSLGFEKEDNFDFSVKFGTIYYFYNNFALITSYQYKPNRMGIGTIFSVNNIHVCYAIRTHDHLNLSHYITLYYEISK